MTNNIFMSIGTGLGDVLLYCLVGDVGYLKPWKEKHPEAKTRLRILTLNDRVTDLFYQSTCVDEIETTLWTNELENAQKSLDVPPHEGFRLLTEEDKATLTREPMEIILNGEETRLLETIQGRGPYLAVHPFAGDPHRSFEGHFAWKETLIALAESCLHVVVLGGDSRRTDRGRTLLEGFRWEHPNITNLTNWGTVRLHTRVTMGASMFLGTSSAYNCVAHAAEVPKKLTVVPNHLYDHIRKDNNGIFYLMRTAGTKIIFWGDGPVRATEQIMAWSRSA